jgi:hypothetical protein
MFLKSFSIHHTQALFYGIPAASNAWHKPIQNLFPVLCIQGESGGTAETA